MNYQILRKMTRPDSYTTTFFFFFLDSLMIGVNGLLASNPP